MKPIFTIHAGEYLVGSYIEENFKGLSIWIPSKDSEIDLLLTNHKNEITVTLQVKFSKDFLTTHMEETFQMGLISCGWWSLNQEKIKRSSADFWVFVLHSVGQKTKQFLIIEPRELHKKLASIHGNDKNIQCYLWVTKKNKCWEARGLNKKDQVLIANHLYENEFRDFTKYLNNWDKIKNRLF